MKSIIKGVVAFIFCLVIYGFAKDVIDQQKYWSYQTGYMDGFKLRNQIDSDSLDAEIKKHIAIRDSIFSEVKSLEQ